MDQQATVFKRTGGRSTLVFRAVRQAVEELIKEHGRERVTISMIAERARVNPTSIYRRWGDLPTLINEMATYRLDPDRPLPDTGDFQSDLTKWAQEIITHYRSPVNAAILRGGASLAGEKESDCLRNRRSEAVLFLERHHSPRFASDDIIDYVVAPIVYRVIFQPWTLDDDTGKRLVDHLFEVRRQENNPRN